MAFTEKQYSGKWAGQYTYGESYGERLSGKSVPFTLVMEVGGDGVMNGHILDDGYADSIDARAKIRGVIRGVFIEFVKTYRHHWQTTKDGGVEENKERPSQEVHYAGQYRNNVFAGEWKIFSAAVQVDGSIREWSNGGYWIMHKEV
jgi:hypothetical protein